jgi:hypothetical protein
LAEFLDLTRGRDPILLRTIRLLWWRRNDRCSRWAIYPHTGSGSNSWIHTSAFTMQVPDWSEKFYTEVCQSTELMLMG